MLDTTVHCARRGLPSVAIYGHSTDNPGLAVTPYMGKQYAPLRIDPQHWTLTHVPTGCVVAHLGASDPAEIIDLANQIGPVIDWLVHDPAGNASESDLDRIRAIINEWERNQHREDEP